MIILNKEKCSKGRIVKKITLKTNNQFLSTRELEAREKQIKVAVNRKLGDHEINHMLKEKESHSQMSVAIFLGRMSNECPVDQVSIMVHVARCCNILNISLEMTDSL